VVRAVLDANVYVSAAVRPEGPPGQIIDQFLRHGAFEIVMSHAIVEEVLPALGKAGSQDPDDDMYIAAAIEGRAGFVVAGDADRLDLKQYQGIRIVRPRAHAPAVAGSTTSRTIHGQPPVII
jgi:uncharacterized protein